MDHHAYVVPAPGLKDGGHMGVRGFRAHCSECGFLSEVKDGHFGAHHVAREHNLVQPLLDRIAELEAKLGSDAS